MSITQIAASHWPQILQLQAGAYLAVEPESLTVLQSKWQQSPDTCFIFQRREQVLGYLLAHSWNRYAPPKLFMPLPANCDGSVLFIHDLAVAVSAKGQGIGQTLFAHLLALARGKGAAEIRLVAVQNSSAFWQKQGFIALEDEVDESYGAGARYFRYLL